MSESKSGIYVATETFSMAGPNGESYMCHKGTTRVRAGHYLLKSAPQYFEPVELSVDYDIEQATAAPGEKRGETRDSATGALRGKYR